VSLATIHAGTHRGEGGSWRHQRQIEAEGRQEARRVPGYRALCGVKHCSAGGGISRLRGERGRQQGEGAKARVPEGPSMERRPSHAPVGPGEGASGEQRAQEPRDGMKSVGGWIVGGFGQTLPEWTEYTATSLVHLPYAKDEWTLRSTPSQQRWWLRGRERSHTDECGKGRAWRAA